MFENLRGLIINREQICPSVGAVIIGRNEGERLKRCLASVQAQLDVIVYVDSGSSDGSSAFAKSIGVNVVNLDMSIPFNAGRARNEGFKRLGELADENRYVQFIDGDCELCPGWIDIGIKYLDANEAHALVFGRVKESHPEDSIYNWLCDVEWQKPEGDVRSCGGIFLARATAFSMVDGFNPTMVAGEEPELCYRLRMAGWRLHALSEKMTLHDAAMYHFSQWWRRTVRSGHAYANGLYLHHKEKNTHHLRENLRILAWALVIPLVTILAASTLGSIAFLILLLYPVQLFRQYYKAIGLFSNPRKAFYYAFFITIAKFPQFLGQLLFIRRKILNAKPHIIEYK